MLIASLQTFVIVIVMGLIDYCYAWQYGFRSKAHVCKTFLLQVKSIFAISVASVINVVG